MKKFSLLMLFTLIFSMPLFADVDGEPEFQYVIAKSGLWMREEPNPKGKQIVLIPYDTKVKFIEKKNEWVKLAGTTGRWKKVEFNGKTGWVYSGFLSWNDANHSIPTDLFGAWVKDKTKKNSIRCVFDTNTMGIMSIFGEDATTFRSYSIIEWKLENNVYLMDFENDRRQTVRYKIQYNAKTGILSINEIGYGTTEVIRE